MTKQAEKEALEIVLQNNNIAGEVLQTLLEKFGPTIKQSLKNLAGGESFFDTITTTTKHVKDSRDNHHRIAIQNNLAPERRNQLVAYCDSCNNNTAHKLREHLRVFEKDIYTTKAASLKFLDDVKADVQKLEAAIHQIYGEPNESQS